MIALNDLKIDLGMQASEAGLDVDGTLDLSAAIGFVDALDETLPKFTLGVDLTPDGSITVADRFFVKGDRVVISADVHDSDLNLDARIGFLGVGVVHGTFDLTADLSINLVDPNGNGKITANEFTTPLTSLFTFNPSGTLAGHLPIQVQSGIGFNPTVGAVELSAIDLFDPATFSMTFDSSFDPLFDFNNMDKESLKGVFVQLKGWLAKFPSTDGFNIEIPFVDSSLAEALDFGTAFDMAVQSKIDFDRIETLQDFVAEITRAGLIPPGEAVSFNLSTQTLTIPIAFEVDLDDINLRDLDELGLLDLEILADEGLIQIGPYVDPDNLLDDDFVSSV